MKKLLKFSDWYLDEFQVVGFVVTDQEGYDVLIDICNDIRSLMRSEHINDICLEFGTNYAVGYETVDDMLKYIEVTDISDVQAMTITSLFGDTYGYFPGKFLAAWLHDKIVERDMR
jgi:hypothetical protein